MMKRIVLAVAAVAFGVTAVVAQSDPIAARKALMKENGKQSGIAPGAMGSVWCGTPSDRCYSKLAAC